MMRPTHSDAIALARFLYAQPQSLRSLLCASALHEAETASAYRRRTGQVHPVWGDGTLAGWVGQRGPLTRAEPGLDDPSYAACLACVLQGISQPETSSLKSVA